MTDWGLAPLRLQLEAIANGSASPSGFPLTDLGNAERLVARHGDDLRYARGIGWLAWDGTTESEVVVAPADLDADPFLLNVETARSTCAPASCATTAGRTC